ncbi:hypothetical protein ACH4ZX_29555 [Streptomyces sp. NPDC020490]|uniref:hypothetical protein n=1 Tax=Streptomyces sp. NPDC020490 TaxID=3365078 RepID=UPI0037BABCC2
MRVTRIPALTAAVLALVLLAGCRTDGLGGAHGRSSKGTSKGTSRGSSKGMSKGSSRTGPSAGPGKTRTARPTATPSTRRVVDAATAGGLARVTGPDAPGDTVIDPGEMRGGMRLVVNGYARSGAGSGDAVLVVAVDNVPEETTGRREHLWRGMLDHIRWDDDQGRPEARPVDDPGALGGSVECMLASLAEDGDVICGWADAGTAGVAHFPGSTPAEAGKLFVAMRADLEK